MGRGVFRTPQARLRIRVKWLSLQGAVSWGPARVRGRERDSWLAAADGMRGILRVEGRRDSRAGGLGKSWAEAP